MDFQTLLDSIKNCQECASHLPLGARPVIQIHPDARILVAGQAPGRRVHETGIPFDDASGDRLRQWMGIDRATFYDAKRIAVVGMGFCYPGSGKSGDLPPRPECAPKWRRLALDQLPNIELTLLIGKYAVDWHFKNQGTQNLTDRVQNWRSHQDDVIALPHPSPRNNIWLKKNPWFEAELVPQLRLKVSKALQAP